MNLIQVFRMLRILLILSFTKIKANFINKLPTNLEKLWISSQVLIYHNPDKTKDFRNQDPDCFGNFIATHYIITAASCFMDVNEILKYSETNDKTPNAREEKDIISTSIKKNINFEKTRIAKVNIW